MAAPSLFERLFRNPLQQSRIKITGRYRKNDSDLITQKRRQNIVGGILRICSCSGIRADKFTDQFCQPVIVSSLRRR